MLAGATWIGKRNKAQYRTIHKPGDVDWVKRRVQDRGRRKTKVKIGIKARNVLHAADLRVVLQPQRGGRLSVSPPPTAATRFR